MNSMPIPTIPLDFGLIHFVGIGGIGMSGIAEVLYNQGYEVTGSDQRDSPNVQRLRHLGIKVRIGHQPGHVADVGVVVVSSAIDAHNPEVQAARAAQIPIVRRADMLAELMRLKSSIAVGGTHGKTTTTSLIAHMLVAGGADPTVVNGGILEAYGSNAVLGGGTWLVAEADESDGTFTRLPSTIGVVTNMDPEHMDHYGTVERLQDAFATFIANVPFYGFGLLCIDHPTVQSLKARVVDRRIVTYGLSPQADVRADNLRPNDQGVQFDLVLQDPRQTSPESHHDFFLPMWGEHNVQNALAALAIGVELGFDTQTLKRGLAEFRGVKRRFSHVGTWNQVTIIDDYGHHPVEIEAVLSAARSIERPGKLIALMQPHRYSRLRDLFDDFCTCFNQADHVIIADVFAAGEAPIDGVDKNALVEGLARNGHRSVEALSDASTLATLIRQRAQPGDMLICLGAGSISTWANSLQADLEALDA